MESKGEDTSLRGLLAAVKALKVGDLDAVLGEDTAMNDKDLATDNVAEREYVEDLEHVSKSKGE